MADHSSKHPGFAKVAEEIGKNPKIDNPNAVLGAANKKQREKAAHGEHVSNPRMLRKGGRHKG